MLSEKGRESLCQFVPYFSDRQIDYYAGGSELTDDKIESLTERYSDKFSNKNFKERENLLKGLADGISFDKLDRCVDVCMKNKQKQPYLHHRSDDGDIDTSETIRLYCMAYKAGKLPTDMQNLDDLIVCAERAENLAECYNVGTGIPCLITDMSQLNNYCLTPNHQESIFDYADTLNNPAIGTVYYADIINLTISGYVLPGYPENRSVPSDLCEKSKPFMTRQFNSLRNLSAKIKEIYNSGFIAKALNITGKEVSLAIAQNNRYTGRESVYRNTVFGVYGEAYRSGSMTKIEHNSVAVFNDREPKSFGKVSIPDKILNLSKTDKPVAGRGSREEVR